MSPSKILTNRRLTRRAFLQGAAISLGASCLACTGLTIAATQQPQPEQAATPAFTFGKETSMNQKIFVAYASRTGSTVGVAAAMGETFAARGFTVDVKPVREIAAVEGYHAVVIGSAVNGGQWLPEAVEFVNRHQGALKQIPLALFCVHIMNLGADEKSREKRLAYLDAVRKLVTPVDEAFFAGVGMDPHEKNLLIRLANRLFIGVEGDCRDWAAIRGWGEKVFG